MLVKHRLSFLVFLMFFSVLFPSNKVEAANTYSVDLERSSSQYLSVADSAVLSITGNMTIEAWIKFESLPTAGTGEQMVVAGKYSNTGDQRSYYLSYGDDGGTNRLRFAVSSDGTAANTIHGNVDWSPSTATWYHVAVVYSAAAGSAEFFVDGVSVGTATSLKTSVFDSTAAFHVGSDDISGFADGFDGLIDEVRVWNVARGAVEIADDRSKEIYGIENGLVGYWKFNNSLTDLTNNGNNLTNNNTAVFSSNLPFSGFTESLVIRKNSNESVANSIVLQSDNHLNLNLATNSTYILEGVIFATSTSAVPDLLFALHAQTGSILTVGYTTNDVNGVLLTSGVVSTSIPVSDSAPVAVHLKGTVKTSSTSGQLQLKWAQNSSNSTPVTLLEGSYLKAEAL